VVVNEGNGRRSLQLMVQDMRATEAESIATNVRE